MGEQTGLKKRLKRGGFYRKKGEVGLGKASPPKGSKNKNVAALGEKRGSREKEKEGPCNDLLSGNNYSMKS